MKKKKRGAKVVEKPSAENAAGLTQGGKQMESETIEARLTAANAVVESLNSKISESDKLLSEAAIALKSAEEAKAKAESENAANAAALVDALARIEKLEAVAAPAETQAAAIVAACKADPVNVSPAAESTAKTLTVLEQYNALPAGSKARLDFYKANKKAIWAATV